jgi:hypothetical protein
LWYFWNFGQIQMDYYKLVTISILYFFNIIKNFTNLFYRKYAWIFLEFDCMQLKDLVNYFFLSFSFFSIYHKINTSNKKKKQHTHTLTLFFKINNFKNSTLKAECIEKKFEFWILLRRRQKYWKWCNYLKNIFFILKIFIKKQGVKIWIMTIMMIKQIDFKKKSEQIVHK